MTTPLTRSKLRIALNVTSKDAIVDVNTGKNAQVWRGTLAQVELALYQGATLVDDLTGIESITLEIRSNEVRSATPYITKTIEAVDLDATLDAATWAAGTKQHALIELDETDTDLPSQGTSAAYWLVISAVLTDGPVTLGAGVLTIIEDGAGSAGSGSSTYYTTAQADARYMRRAMPNASFRTDANGQHLQLWDPDLSQWRTLIIEAGALALGPGEA